MNISDSKKEVPYLEDVSASAEYMFATANIHHVMSNDRITYFDAFNMIGEKVYKTDWTGREFFARRGSTEIAEYQEHKQLYYSLFNSKEEENVCAGRIGVAEYPIIMALRAGELQAYYTNHHTGEETPLETLFWRSQNCSYTRTTGYFKAPDRNKRPVAPGIDFIVVFDLKGFGKVLRTMPKPRNSDQVIPLEKDFKKANKLIIEFCAKHKFFLSRDIYYAALNQILDTDYCKDSNTRPYWEAAVPASIKNRPGYKNPNPLILNELPKSL